MVRKIISAVLVVILLFAFFNLVRQISNALGSGKRLDQAADQLSQLQQQHQKLEDQLSQVQSQDYIEKIARNELDYSKPGETVVIIPQDQIDKIVASEKKPEEVVLPNWQGWLKLIFH